MNNNPVIVEKIYTVSISRVWQAITDKEQMEEWYFTIDDFRLEKGVEFNFHVTYEDKDYYHQCVIKEIIPYKKLVHTWTHPTLSKGESLVTWELTPVDKGTKLTLTHSGLENFADLGEDFTHESHEQGWEEILGIYLKDFLNN
ncbi:MAG: SRPBCC domain-containing protein [Dysgonomonas sp.]|nr:SRPBCC domain-containing protein [Dysgonomonas sp.]